MAELSKAELKRKLKEKIGLEPQRHVFLCTGSNCHPDIATRTERLLRRRLRELGALHSCPITAVDCLKLCRSGPIALVYPEGTYYCGVTPEVAEQIVGEHLIGGAPVEEFVFASAPLPTASALKTHASDQKTEEITKAKK